MTLIEMLVAIALGTLIFAVVGRLSLFATRSYLALGNYNDLDQASQNALDTMSRDIRQAWAVSAFVTNGVQRISFDDNTLTYQWNPTTRNLVRSKTGQADRILLTQCDSLSFRISQQNVSNNFNFYGTTDLGAARLIDVTWTCSRKILQAKVNTETVQTAKIVLRNRKKK